MECKLKLLDRIDIINDNSFLSVSVRKYSTEN